MKNVTPPTIMRMSRRQFLKASTLGSASLLLPWGLTTRPAHATHGLAHFRDPLPIPRTFRPSTDGQYYVRMREFKHEIHSDVGPVTTVWGFGDVDGFSYPGPSFDVMTGQTVPVHWINELAASPDAPHYFAQDQRVLDYVGGAENRRKVTIHLHGGHITSATDGLPTDFFYPGQVRYFPYDIDQDASTLWYHDHTLGMSRMNVVMGLAGFFIVRDAHELDLIASGGLPSPAHEIPLVLQDRKISNKGRLKYPSTYDDAFFGDVLLVNGRAWPHLEVERRKYRFRLLNGSNARNYTLQLGDGASSFWQIGTDQGLLAAPVLRNWITLTPGERAEIVIDFAQFAGGDDIILINTHRAMGGGANITDIIQFRVRQGSVTDPVTLPAILKDIPKLDEALAVRERQFILEDYDDPNLGEAKWLMNGLGHDDPVTDFVQNDTLEIWTWVNKSEMYHPMHPHLVKFQVLGRYRIGKDSGGNPVPGANLGLDPNEMGWKDTVNVRGKEMVRVIARFKGKATELPNEHFTHHCHVLEHENHDMARMFMLEY